MIGREMKAPRWLSRLPVLVLVFMMVAPASHVNGRRIKRRLDEFGSMIVRTTNKNPMDFNGYGNYCGLGGRGVALDAIDKCCEIHDSCYAGVNRKQCKTLLKYKVYTTRYEWEESEDGDIVCKDTEECPQTICRCDRDAAICFGAHVAEYDKSKKHSAITRGLAKLLGMS